MKPQFAILFTAATLLGCSTPQPLPLTELKTLTFGEPIIQGPLLHIPVITNDGQGYRKHSAKKICDVHTQVFPHTLTFRLSECSRVRGLNRTPTLELPILTIPHTGPATYNLAYIDPDDTLIPLGQVVINDSTVRVSPSPPEPSPANRQLKHSEK